MGSILALGVQGEAVAAIRREALLLEDIAVEEIEALAEGLVRIGRGPPRVEVLVLGPAIDAPVQLAQRVYSVDPQLPILIQTEPQRLPEIARAVQFAPLLGEEIRCLPAANELALVAEIREVVAQSRARQAHRRILAALNERLTTERAHIQPVAADYMGLLLQHVPVGVVATDPQGKVLAWNCAAAALFGRSERDVLGSSLPAMFSESEQGKWTELLSRSTRAGAEAVRYVFGRHLLDGREQLLEVTAAPFMSRTRECAAMLILQDVTERVLSERERARAEEERALMVQELRKAVHVRDEFLSIAAHELKTPLTSLKLQVQRFFRDPHAQRATWQDSRLNGIQRSLGRLSKLIDNLLDVSRLRVDRLSLEREEVDLVAVTREVLSRLSEECTRSGSEVELHAPERLVGRWDRFRLEQIVTNLLENALKYGQGKPVELGIRREGGHGWLTIRDHGMGISLEDQARIFERFERAVSQRHYGGFGLGLWIVRQLIEAHGGQISVRSAPGEGALFSVQLPLDGS